MKYGAQIRGKSTFAPGHPVLPATTEKEKDIKEEVAAADLRMVEQLETQSVVKEKVDQEEVAGVDVRVVEQLERQSVVPDKV